MSRPRCTGLRLVEVRLRGRPPAPTAAYDAACALGSKLLAQHRLSRVQVVVNCNRSKVLAWRFHPQAVVSVHWALVPFPDEVMAAIARTPGSWEALRERLPTPEPPPTRSQGDLYDLEAVLADQRARHLPQAPELVITWGQWPRVAPRRSLRLGSCAPPLVRIHPVLDHASVPDWFVGFVVFHEMLHAVHVPRTENGRRKVHPPEFRRAEAMHPDWGRAEQWERANVVRLIRRCAAHVRARRTA